MTDFVDRYGHQNVGRFDLAGALTELFRLVRKHHVALSPPARDAAPPDGAARGLVAPAVARLLVARAAGADAAADDAAGGSTRNARRRKPAGSSARWSSSPKRCPAGCATCSPSFSRARFEVHLDHRGLEPSVNRLVLGLLTCALILGGSLMVSREVWPLYGVSTPGRAGVRVQRAARAAVAAGDQQVGLARLAVSGLSPASSARPPPKIEQGLFDSLVEPVQIGQQPLLPSVDHGEAVLVARLRFAAVFLAEISTTLHDLR